jgi:glycosyltransferase involved in cell wall biosynthesis
VHILLLNQYYAPDEAATAQILSDVGVALVEAGHEVTAICGDRSYADPARVYPPFEIIDGVTVQRVKGSAQGRASKRGRLKDYATYYLGAARRLLFARRPELVIALTTPPMISLLASTVGHWRGAKSIFWSMDVYPDIAWELGAIRRDSFAGAVLAWLSRKTLQRADCSIALGETMAERLREHGARRVEVVHNWAETVLDAQRPTSDPNPLREAWGWGNRFVVMYSGNMGLAHEFETLIDAARKLRHRNDILFSFVGGGPRRAEVETKVRELELPNVEFRPYVKREELARSLAAPDLHLVTLREAMPGLLVPSKIYGILAAGKAVLYVGPPEGEVADMVRRGRCGVRVDIGDVAALVRTIEWYASDASALQLDGERARELYDAEFTRAKSIGRFVQIVDEIGKKIERAAGPS